MSRRLRNIAILALLATAFVVVRFALAPARRDGRAQVYMLDVGQGDSFLVVAPDGRKLLIDGGPDAHVLAALARILPAGDRNIDVVIATHPDADHIGGLRYVLDRYEVGLFLTSDVRADTKTFAALFQTLEASRIPSYYARRGMKLSLDATHGAPPTDFSIIFPDRPTTNWNTNPASVVGVVQVGPVQRASKGIRILFTGDSTSSVEHFLAQTVPGDLDVDILKLGHHGSKFSSSFEYLKATSPALSLISAGVGNRYGHPNGETLARLKTLGIPWVSTQDRGTVELSVDGISWKEIDEK